MNKYKNNIGITMGDPAGVGPEIILKAFKDNHLKDTNQIIIIGDLEVLKKLNQKLSFSISFNELNNDLSNLNNNYQKNKLNVVNLNNVDIKNLIPGKVSENAGKAAVEFILKAIDLAMDKKIDAVVTAPINKKAIQTAGFKYPGHTEIFAEKTGTKDYAMMLYSDKLNVAHVSTHMSLLDACKTLKQERVETVIELANNSLKNLGIDNPRIAVAGLNPHAGEKGLFGEEEEKEIRPAVDNAKEKNINVFGPIPPDTVFVKAVNGDYDIVVVMYHDQGHIPVKLLGFDSGVNVTLGLPIIRTSVDHGTAFDIAWKGKAYDTSLVKAIEVAEKMAENKID